MASAPRPRGLELEPLNLTPLLDVLFNLIFFFLLATQLREEKRVIEVQIPQAGVHTETQRPEREWVVTIGPEGSLFLNEDAVTSGQLQEQLAEAAKEPEKALPVRIRIDQATPGQAIVDVMEICHETGHPNFGLEVAKRERGP
jgi:biopolymer transport protein ExbD